MSAGFAGRLRERVRVFGLGDGRDALGGAAADLIFRGMVWAALEPEGRGTFFSADAASARPVWQVTMRPCEILVGDLVEWDWASIMVRELRLDPRVPDRIVAIGEELP
jgi:hypothetical protein